MFDPRIWRYHWLWRQWKQLWWHSHANGDGRQAYFGLIESLTQPHRCYHSVPHAIANLRAMHAKHPYDNHFHFAALFEHAYFDPNDNHSSEKSAEIFLRVGQKAGFHRAWEINPVTDLIMRMRYQDKSSPGSAAADLRDANLSILGQPSEKYILYVQQVAREHVKFGGMSLTDWFGRRQETFLEPFLAQPTIFLTSTYAHLYEAQARLNLATELELMRERRWQQAIAQAVD